MTKNTRPTDAKSSDKKLSGEPARVLSLGRRLPQTSDSFRVVDELSKLAPKMMVSEDLAKAPKDSSEVRMAVVSSLNAMRASANGSGVLKVKKDEDLAPLNPVEPFPGKRK